MRTKTYKCEDCGTSAEFSSYKKARAADWAVAKDYKNCYCPDCAPNHRRGGANKENTGATLDKWQPPKGWEQLSIEKLK